MNIVGICRFSLIGRGDWKAFRGVSDAELERIALKQAESLFLPERIEHRLATLGHLTLASMKAQTDQDFLFIVLASELMPQPYRDRLVEICAAVPQVRLRFFPLTSVGAAQKQVFDELGLSLRDTLQFRLDDDDALSANYIERMRVYCSPMAKAKIQFSASFPTVAFIKSGDGTGYLCNMPFMSAGAAVHNHRQSVFGFGHFGLSRRFMSINIPSCHSLISKHGSNDSPIGRRAPRGAKALDAEAVQTYLETKFPFITDQGKQLLGHGATETVSPADGPQADENRVLAEG